MTDPAYQIVQKLLSTQFRHKFCTNWKKGIRHILFGTETVSNLDEYIEQIENLSIS